MNRTEKITLIASEYVQDDIGEWVETPIRRDIFARIDSVSAAEFFNAGLQGMRPDYRFLIWRNEYKGEQIVEYRNDLFDVYRTYNRNDNRIELYVNSRKGVEGNDT